MLADFLRGGTYFFMAFKLIRQPQLMRFVWVPLLCNIVLFIFMLIFAGYGLKQFSDWVVHFLPRWLQWLEWVVFVLSILFSGIALIYISTILVNTIAGPFNSILSAKVIQYLKVPDQSQDISILKAVPVAIARQTRFILYYLPRAVFYLILFIIPFVQLFSAVFWFLFNGWVFAMQYLDYPMDNHGVSIKQMRELMANKREVCLGFGCAVVLVAMIPFVNFIIVPVAVVGATLLWVREFRS